MILALAPGSFIKITGNEMQGVYVGILKLLFMNPLWIF